MGTRGAVVSLSIIGNPQRPVSCVYVLWQWPLRLPKTEATSLVHGVCFGHITVWRVGRLRRVPLCCKGGGCPIGCEYVATRISTRTNLGIRQTWPLESVRHSSSRLSGLTGWPRKGRTDRKPQCVGLAETCTATTSRCTPKKQCSSRLRHSAVPFSGHAATKKEN
jgi:hypothetical protein